jgi:ankyrin repeat protein
VSEPLLALSRAIAAHDEAAVKRLLAASPALATARLTTGATRREAAAYFLEEIRHYVYAGDSALHVAAAAHHPSLAGALLKAGADVDARNRRGAAPLHYAADGGPAAPAWDRRAQAATIARLLAAGADPNALDGSGVTPLHRAVRNRCASAVRALLEGGADARRKSGKGSTALFLATRPTGRGGSGTPAAKAEQAEILRLLGASR